jgi:hypothetical protein
MTDYPAVLAAIRPGAQWTLDGDDYAGLTWLDDSPKPTKKTLDDAWPQVQADLELARIQAERARRYQLEADPLFFKAQRDEATMAQWRTVVDQIRADLPYPAEVTR